MRETEVSLPESVKQYTEWLSSNAPSVYAEIRAGLSPAAQEELCQEYDLALSGHAVQLYAEIDGQDELGSLAGLPIFPDEMGLRLLPLEVAASLRTNLLGAEVLYRSSNRRQYEATDVGAQFWKASWLPIAEARDERRGRYQKLVLELEPGPDRGASEVFYEQLIVLPERESVRRVGIAGTLPAFFAAFVASLASGNVVFRERVGLIVVP